MSWAEHEGTGLGEAEKTLRVIAALPAPDGLAERVQGRLREAPKRARVLSWPGTVMRSALWRGAAAAAIVCVAAGGAWGVYRQVAPAMAARNTAPQVRVRPEGGFANAGAMRTPDSVLKTEAPRLEAPRVDAQKTAAAGAHPDARLTKKAKPAAKKTDSSK